VTNRETDPWLSTPGSEISTSPEEMRLLQEIIADHCGISQGLDSTVFLERRLGPRLEALGLTSYREYYQYLRYDPGGPREMEELIERITTHETYLFREQYQLDAFSEELIPEIHERLRLRRRLAIWSAGCSTGEEVYTLAILLKEDGRFEGWSVRVAGSDISRKVVVQARRGTYGMSSFRTTSPHLRRKYFHETNGKYRIRDDVRSLCSFGQLNLLDIDRYKVLGRYDLIFCRNVLMYLSSDARQRVIDAFYDTLMPGGYLLLGHSESLLNLTTLFDLVHLSKDLVYQRPL
jgi:chemotaxis protein methyltransferase CheR